MAALLLALLVAPALSAGKRKERDAAELTNLFLSPELSRWLVGPVARLASDQEERDYLALRDDAAAQQFIERFWQRRGPEPVWPSKGVRQRFEERVERADRIYAEGPHRGYQTARGTIFVVYGEPDETRFEVAPGPAGTTIEVWEYGKDAEPGLDGQRPPRIVRFAQRNGVTDFYHGPIPRQRLVPPRRTSRF